MVARIWISLFLSIVLIIFLPLLFGGLMATSLAKLHLGPESAFFVVLAIVFGGFVNIPVKRIQRTQYVSMHPLAAFGLLQFWPQLRRMRRVTIIAVNVGGCLVPTALAIYELIWLARTDFSMLWSALFAAMVNIIVCFILAQPLSGVGITLPGLVPAITAAIVALWVASDQAAPVAFIAGVAGPLVGADLLHLNEVENIGSGIVSIGGAGTFDGIVLSGIVAAYLA